MHERPQRSPPQRQRVELKFLEALRKRCPSHEPLLEALGNLYTRVGRYEDGLQVDLELTKLRPREPENWYNLGCSHALVGDKENALAALEHAVDIGYSDGEWMSKDADLTALHGDHRFLDLVKRLTSRVRWDAT